MYDHLLHFLYSHYQTAYFNPRSLLGKIVTRSLEGGGGGGVEGSNKFGTYNKLHLYFQLSETKWCLIGFHGNNSEIKDVTDGRHLGFSNFQFCCFVL